MIKLGEAKKEATQKVWHLLDLEIPPANESADACSSMKCCCMTSKI